MSSASVPLSDYADFFNKTAGVYTGIVGVIIFLLNPEYIKLLFSGVGRFMLIMAIVMQVIGYLWIRKIVNIEI